MSIVCPIELAKIEAAYPSIASCYGPADFQYQVSILLANKGQGIDETMIRVGRAERYANLTLLRMILAAHYFSLPQAAARLKLLEKQLGECISGGISLSNYSSMIRSSESVLDLIHELDWTLFLKSRGGQITPHVPTDPKKSNKNFDIHCTIAGNTIHGDVKVFKDWLSKATGTDFFRSLTTLLGTDFNHRITVRVKNTPRYEEQCIEAALLVWDGYCIAVDGERTSKWNVVKRGSEVTAVLLCESDELYPVDDNRLIDSVSISLTTQGKTNQVLVTEPLEIDGVDHGAIRRCIRDAASQISETKPQGVVSCVFLGSGTGDTEQTAEVLFDDRDIGGGVSTGIFSAGFAEPGYDHIDAVVNFSIRFDVERDGECTVHRSCRIMGRKSKLSDLDFLARLCDDYASDRTTL